MSKIILTTYIIGNKEFDYIKVPSNVEIIRHNSNTDYTQANGTYISFVDSEDRIDKNYFKYILKEIKKKEFNLCYINYQINYNYKRLPKVRNQAEEINNLIPLYSPYVWNYVFSKDLLLKIHSSSIKKEDLTNIAYIPEPLYFHNKDHLGTTILSMTTRKRTVHFKNIIYVGSYCNGLFNGYITWLIELGKIYNNLDIAIIYTKIHETTKQRLSKYFKCIQYNPSVNFTCEKLITTYSTYYYPNNIHSLEESILFIHGNMSDYPTSKKFTDDIYDRYIAVSKISQERAKGYFPTKKIEYIYNPYTLEETQTKPHLKLVSALRNSPEKGIDRIKKIASILDEENIPYTWSVFTDVLEPNQGGLIFRNAIINTIDYIKDADYLVQLSSSEALSYSLTEALCAKTKVITTDIPAIIELNIKDNENAFVIPIKYFEEKNKELLKQKVLEAYEKKDMTFDYYYDPSRFSDYDNVFNK